MAAARDRCGLVPEESLSPLAALDLFTFGAATALGDDASIQPGAQATFTILSEDPLAASADQLRDTRVISTWVEGAAVPIPDGISSWQS
jgi:predicted amidohydrolase YtcJ